MNKTRAVCGLFDTTDLGHQPLLLVFLFCWGRHDVHVMLLLWKTSTTHNEYHCQFNVVHVQYMFLNIL